LHQAAVAAGLAVMIAVVFSFVIAHVASGSSPHIEAELLWGADAGLAAGLLTLLWSSSAVVRYAIGAACAASRRRLPLRLSEFTAWACESGLLRVAGNSYVFRHRELQDWLIQSIRPRRPTPSAHIEHR
jgi:hypothetical protein